MPALRVGLVGAGPWAREHHAPAVAGHQRTRLTAVWTRRPGPAAELAAAYGARAFAGPDDYSAFLDDVDAVVFSVPPHAQADLAVTAAAAGRHLVCEKPLGATAAQAAAVVDAVARAGVLSAMSLPLRHDPQVKDWLATLPAATDPPGPDVLASLRFLSGALLDGPYAGSGWRAEHGALLDVGPHALDLLDAAAGRIVGVDWAHRDEPDLWRCGLRHVGGARSTAVLTLRLPVTSDGLEVAVHGAGGSHRLPQRTADTATCLAGLLDEFTAAVAGDGPPPVLDVAHGLHLQQIIDEVAALAAGTR